jgi:uncharacterized protein YciI
MKQQIMQQFIYILRLQPHYRKAEHWTEATNEIIGKHFNYLKGLHDKGVAILVGKSDYDIDNTDNFGMCIFQSENLEAANALMNNDPCILNGVMYAELHPFRISLH